MVQISLDRVDKSEKEPRITLSVFDEDQDEEGHVFEPYIASIVDRDSTEGQALQKRSEARSTTQPDSPK